MYVSKDILYEYKNVLRLKKFKFEIDYQYKILEKIKSISTIQEPDHEVKFSRDKYDSAFLSLAKHINADVLFTQDKTLLKADHLVSTKIQSL